MVKYTLLFFLIISVNAMVNAETLADPTKPIDYKSKPVTKTSRAVLPKLQSILVEGEQRQAIINNRSYRAGQRVNGYQIARIKKDAVLLRYKSKSYKLTLYTGKEHFLK